MRTVDTREPIRGVAAGVPYVALPPAQDRKGAPLVVAWHLASPPRSETAMAAALPLRGLPAWRVYLGLPMLGSRLPEGGLDEFFRLFREDAVLNLFEPITRQAVEEFPAALAGLRERLAIGDGPLGLVGGSMGAWVALSALADTDAPVSTVALVSPAIRLTSVVARYERLWGVNYAWSERSLAVAERLDFVARAGPPSSCAESYPGARPSRRHWWRSRRCSTRSPRNPVSSRRLRPLRPSGWTRR